MAYKNLPPLSLSIDLAYRTTKIEGELDFAYSPFKNLVKKDGSLDNFRTSEISFCTEKPLDIIAQDFFDGSVNLIISDDKNPPKLINNRFIVKEDRTYAIPDHFGSKDTNLYQEEDLKLDTNLYKTISQFPTLEFLGTSHGGAMPCGNYHFYFKLMDNDENATDFVLESGLVSCFIGSSPHTIRMGVNNENTNKLVNFKLDNLDGAYDYVSVFMSRGTSTELDQSLSTTYFRIDKKFPINKSGGSTFITITGNESQVPVTIYDINPRYFLVSAAKTMESCQNRLFLGNVETKKINHEDIQDVTLRTKISIDTSNSIGFLNSKYKDISSAKHKNEYYNPHNIYYNLGYWPGEIYRFGIVYILEDYTFSPVFNVSGGELSKNGTIGKSTSIYVPPGPPDTTERQFINVEESGFYSSGSLENARGVIKLPKNINPIGKRDIKPIGLNFVIPTESWEYLKKTYNFKGYFIVRQKRIPLTLAQGVAIAKTTDSFGNVPVLRGYSGGNEYGLYESFIKKNNRMLGKSLNIDIPLTNLENKLMIVPEYELREPTFNNIFTGTDLILTSSYRSAFSGVISVYMDKHFEFKDINKEQARKKTKCRVLGIPDSTNLVSLNDTYFTSKVGMAMDVSKFSDVNLDWRSAKNDEYGGAYFAGMDTSWSFKNGFQNQSLVWPKIRADLMQSTSVVRGEFGKYVAMDTNVFKFGDIINIHPEGYEESYRYYINEFEARMESTLEGYFAITPWIDTNSVVAFRGDCFIGNFTHRMIRNHTDPQIPYNNKIVDEDTWKENLLVWQLAPGVEQDGKRFAFNKISNLFNTYLKYTATGWDSVGPDEVRSGNIFDEDVEAPKKGWAEKLFSSYSDKKHKRITKGASFMNQGDINSVPLGHWVTIKVLANTNISLRDVDQTHLTEPENRSFYPYSEYNTTTLPDSDILNSASATTVSSKVYAPIHDTPYINQHFDNYILYSEEYASRATNGYRVFEENSFTSLPRTYGGLTKILEMEGNLVAVMEHGIYLVGINERQTISNEQGETQIATGSIISKYPATISDSIGSTWKDSVIKAPSGIYGIDTVAKKIWRFNGKRLEILSDMSVQKFLNDNMELFEGDKKFVHEYKSIKTHYNAFKKDIMFVFSYWLNDAADLDLKDPKNGRRWNLCYNEILGKWITQYTWFPEFSENINNIFYTFANNKLITPRNAQFDTNLNNYLYQHGFAGFSDIGGVIEPTKWYGKQHPFEFEFVVIGIQGIQQIFNNLKIISNLAEPDSFEFEIVGEGYDWKDKKEKILLANQSSGVDLEAKFERYLTNNPSVLRLPFIEVVDPIIFNKDWKTGDRRAEVKLYQHNKTKEVLIKNYQKGFDIREVGRIKGNMQYVEDSWDVQIQPISFKEVKLNSEKEIVKSDVKEMKIRDKYLKIRVRYDGTKYAIVNALRTLYTVSYA